MMFGKPDCWGVTHLGERGQVVIPADLRAKLKLKKGDKMLVISKGDRFIGLMKTDELANELKKVISSIESYKL